jgi:hypothetical protein
VSTVAGEPEQKHQILGFIGVGFDNADGHHRITRSEHFLLVGGSAQTHERMQDTASKFDEKLRRTGKCLREVAVEEIIDFFRDADQE